MRKILETLTLVALGFLIVVTAIALYGPKPLPDRIPTHFDLAGHPNAWGPASDLAVLPFVAFVLYMFLTIVANYPSLTHHRGQVTPLSRRRMESLALGMIAWIKAEMVGIFVCIQITLIQAARRPDHATSLVGVWILLGALIVTISWYVANLVWARRPAPEPVDSREILP